MVAPMHLKIMDKLVHMNRVLIVQTIGGSNLRMLLRQGMKELIKIHSKRLSILCHHSQDSNRKSYKLII